MNKEILFIIKVFVISFVMMIGYWAMLIGLADLSTVRDQRYAAGDVYPVEATAKYVSDHEIAFEVTVKNTSKLRKTVVATSIYAYTDPDDMYGTRVKAEPTEDMELWLYHQVPIQGGCMSDIRFVIDTEDATWDNALKDNVGEVYLGSYSFDHNYPDLKVKVEK